MWPKPKPTPRETVVDISEMSSAAFGSPGDARKVGMKAASAIMAEAKKELRLQSDLIRKRMIMEALPLFEGSLAAATDHVNSGPLKMNASEAVIYRSYMKRIKSAGDLVGSIAKDPVKGLNAAAALAAEMNIIQDNIGE